MMQASLPPKSFKELRQRYANGERDFSGAELDEQHESDLAGVCLDGVDFSRAWIDTSFKGSSLRCAVFHRADVRGCDFDGADLTSADFREAVLCSTTFSGATLDGIRIGGASYHSHVFKDDDIPDW